MWDGKRDPPRRRPQRDRGLPGDRRGGRSGARQALSRSPGAAPAWRKGGDRLRAPGDRPDALRRPADPALLRPLHERHRGEPRRLGLEAGKPGRAARHDGLEARAARARERAGRPRRLPARGRARARAGAVGRGLRGPRPAGRCLRGDAHRHGRREGDGPSGRAARLRLRAPRREQPAGHGLLRARPARPLPGPQPRPRVPPLRPPPPRRARARVRRGEGRGAPWSVRRERLPEGARLRGPRRGCRQHDRPRLVLRAGPGVPGEAERLDALRRLDGVPGAHASRRRSPSSTCPTSPTRPSTPR